MRSTCVGPARAPAPAGPPRPLQRRAEGSAAHPRAKAPAWARHSPSDPGQVIHPAGLSLPLMKQGAIYKPPRRRRCLWSARPPFWCPRSSSKEPALARANPVRPASADAPTLDRLLRVLARGTPESSKDTRGPLWTAVPGGNRIRRACQAAIGGFAEKGQGGGHAAGERQTTVGRAVVSKGLAGGVAEAGASGPEAQRRRWHSRRGGQQRRRGGLNRAAPSEGQENAYRYRRRDARTQFVNEGLYFADSRELLRIVNRRMAVSSLFEKMSLETS